MIGVGVVQGFVGQSTTLLMGQRNGNMDLAMGL